MPTTPNIKMVTPSLDDIPDVPRDLQVIADHLDTKGVGIDADNLGGVTLPDTGAPLSLYGTGRPDTENIQAPVGSEYICIAPDDEANLGARKWTKVDADTWTVSDGVTPWYGANVTSLNVSTWMYSRRTAATLELSVHWMFAQKNMSPHHYYGITWPADVPEEWWLASRANQGFAGFSGSIAVSSDPTFQKTGYNAPLSGSVHGDTLWFFSPIAVAGTPDGHGNSVMSASPDVGWPSATTGLQPKAAAREQIIADYKADLEKLAKDDPEQADLLRAELEALQAGE